MPRLLTRPLTTLTTPLRPVLGADLLRRLRRWPVESQQVARRNAMVACTSLAARRAEREDVEDFLRTVTHAPAVAHA